MPTSKGFAEQRWQHAELGKGYVEQRWHPDDGFGTCRAEVAPCRRAWAIPKSHNNESIYLLPAEWYSFRYEVNFICLNRRRCINNHAYI